MLLVSVVSLSLDSPPHSISEAPPGSDTFPHAPLTHFRCPRLASCMHPSSLPLLHFHLEEWLGHLHSCESHPGRLNILNGTGRAPYCYYFPRGAGLGPEPDTKHAFLSICHGVLGPEPNLASVGYIIWTLRARLVS